MEYNNTLDRMEKSIHKHQEILPSYKCRNNICLDNLAYVTTLSMKADRLGVLQATFSQ